MILLFGLLAYIIYACIWAYSDRVSSNFRKGLAVAAALAAVPQFVNMVDAGVALGVMHLIVGLLLLCEGWLLWGEAGKSGSTKNDDMKGHREWLSRQHETQDQKERRITAQIIRNLDLLTADHARLKRVEPAPEQPTPQHDSLLARAQAQAAVDLWGEFALAPSSLNLQNLMKDNADLLKIADIPEEMRRMSRQGHFISRSLIFQAAANSAQRLMETPVIAPPALPAPDDSLLIPRYDSAAAKAAQYAVATRHHQGRLSLGMTDVTLSLLQEREGSESARRQIIDAVREDPAFVSYLQRHA